MRSKRWWMGVGILTLVTAVPGVVGAPPVSPAYRVAVFSSGQGSLPRAFREELRALGYAPDATMVLEEDSVPPEGDPLLDLSAELATRRVDVIVAWGERAAQALRYATRRVPVVFVVAGDPVAMLLAATLERPGGNMTGVTLNIAGLAVEQVRVLRTLLPTLSYLGVIWDSEEPGQARQYQAVLQAAKSQGIVALSLPMPMLDVDTVARLGRDRRIQALMILSALESPAQVAALQRIAFVLRLPCLFETRAFVRGGGLVSYGPSLTEAARLAARSVDKVLKGAKPSDLPIVQPAASHLTINLETARALRLRVPPALLGGSDAIAE